MTYNNMDIQKFMIGMENLSNLFFLISSEISVESYRIKVEYYLDSIHFIYEDDLLKHSP
jgi:hypothetical protein